MKSPQQHGYGWVAGAAVILGLILLAKWWGPPPAPPTDEDAAMKIMRQLEQDREKATMNR